MRSSLYECRVMHHRFAPKRHRFAYRIFLLAIDLDELGALHQSLRCFSVGKPNLYSFREDDYFPTQKQLHHPSPACALPPPTSAGHLAPSRPPLDQIGSSLPSRPAASPTGAPGLKSRVLAFLAAHQIDLTEGRVSLLTLPRVFGYLFNPVSFYFCYDRTGQPVATIAEVTNTFREVKLYLLGPETRPSSQQQDAPFHLRVPKHFYVSPYSAPDLSFDFTIRPPSSRLSIQIDDYAQTERLLTSMLTGRARPLTDAALVSATVRHPLVTLKIIVLIHWHALLLLTKRLPWFPKTAQPWDQRDLYRPHPSIATSP